MDIAITAFKLCGFQLLDAAHPIICFPYRNLTIKGSNTRHGTQFSSIVVPDSSGSRPTQARAYPGDEMKSTFHRVVISNTYGCRNNNSVV